MLPEDIRTVDCVGCRHFSETVVRENGHKNPHESSCVCEMDEDIEPSDELPLTDCGIMETTKECCPWCFFEGRVTKLLLDIDDSIVMCPHVECDLGHLYPVHESGLSRHWTEMALSHKEEFEAFQAQRQGKKVAA